MDVEIFEGFWSRTIVKCAIFKLVDFTSGAPPTIFSGGLIFEDLLLGFYHLIDDFSNVMPLVFVKYRDIVK